MVGSYVEKHVKVWERAYIWQIGSQHDGSRLDIEWFGYCIRQGAVLLLFCMFGPSVVAYFSRDDKKANKLAIQQWLVESGKSTELVVEDSRVRVDMGLEALNAGTVKAVMLPTGSQYRPAIPPGMKVMEINGDAPGAGWYIYDPTKLRPATIREAAKAGQRHDNC